MDVKRFQGWISIHQTGTDYEADLVRDRLDDAGIPSVVLTQRDHAFNLTVGELAPVHVMIPPSYEKDARAVLDSEPFTDEELEEIAMAADPSAPDAHEPSAQSRVDTGNDRIQFRAPEESDPGEERS